MLDTRDVPVTRRGSPVRVTYFIDSLGSGGAQRQAVEMAISLVKREKIEATFLVYRDNDFFGDRLRGADIEIELLPKRSKIDFHFPLKLREGFRATRPDVVHAFLLSPSFWAALTRRVTPSSERVPLITSERNCLIGTNWRESLIQRFAYGAGDIVTANAAPVVDLIHDRLGISKARIRYIPNGIDLVEWDKELALSSGLELDPSEFNIALIGRYSPQKNHSLLLRALSRIESALTANWRVWFFGSSGADQSCRSEIEEEAQRLGLSPMIRFMDPRKYVGAIMKEMEVIVLPSTHEGFPNVALEALASSVPVVATSVGDIENLVDDGESGFLVASQDEKALAEALEKISQLAPEKRRVMGASGRRKVEARFQVDAVADVYFDHYRQLCGD